MISTMAVFLGVVTIAWLVLMSIAVIPLLSIAVVPASGGARKQTRDVRAALAAATATLR